MIKAGLFSSSSSLVIVPDLSNLTSAEALSALSAVELLVGTTSTTTSGANSSNNGKVSSQSVTSGTLVERYSSVNYVTYFYQAAPPPPEPPPCRNTYTYLYKDACCQYNVYDCNGTYLYRESICSCSSPGTDSSGATMPGCPGNCPPPPPPPPPVTCRTTSVVSTGAGTCPSQYIQNFSCSDGTTYSQCI